jgi:hypothetical protein
MSNSYHTFSPIVIPASAVNNSTFSNVTAVVTGWVSGPNGRGTMDIVWGSLVTIFLCTWTAVCLNIPHPEDSNFKIVLRKAKWMFWACMGPELVLSVAIGQYASARRSVKRFHALGYSQWSLRHAFFADMGGFLLHPRDSTPFTVNSRQLAYLVQKKYLEYPTITAEEIWDRSKADTLSKILTLTQASWLIIQLVGRAITHLATSTLELLAGAIVFCTLGTSICWLQKPTDVNKGITLTTEATITQILIQAGDAATNPYQHTPLDFVAKGSFTCGYDVMGFFNLRCDNHKRPLRSFPNDRFPDISTWEKFALFCMTTAYASVHLIGWRFTFPTRTELLLWRIASLIMTGVTVFFWVFETIAARHRFGRWDKYLTWLRLKTRPPQPEVVEEMGNISHNTTDNYNKEEMQTEVRQVAVHTLDSFEEEQKNAKPMLGSWIDLSGCGPLCSFKSLHDH